MRDDQVVSLVTGLLLSGIIARGWNQAEIGEATELAQTIVYRVAPRVMGDDCRDPDCECCCHLGVKTIPKATPSA